MELGLWQIAALILIGAGGSFVQRVSGFGMGIFAMLFLPHLLGSTTASAAVIGLWSTCTTLYNGIKYRRDAQPRTIAPLICAAMVTIPLAVGASALVPQRAMTVLLGCVLIALSLYFLVFSHRIRIRATVGNGILAGSLGGILGGMFAAGGPPVVLYLTAATADKAAYFANIQLYFAVTNLFSNASRALSGILTGDVFLCAAIGLAGCLLGDGLGLLVFRRLDGAKLKKVIYWMMIASGTSMILK